MNISMAHSRAIGTAKFAILAIIIITFMATQQLRGVESIRLVPSDAGGCQRGLDLGKAESAPVSPDSETLLVAQGSSSMAAHLKLHIQNLVKKAPPPPSGNPTHNG